MRVECKRFNLAVMSWNERLLEIFGEIKTRSGGELNDYLISMPTIVGEIINNFPGQKEEVKSRVVAELKVILDEKDNETRGFAGAAMMVISESSDQLFDETLKTLALNEIKRPGIFNSYEARETLESFEVRRIESWLYWILEKTPAEKLDQGFAFFCHEALFSYRDYLRLKSIPQSFVALMLEDDLLMTSDRLLAKCYEQLDEKDMFRFDEEFNTAWLLGPNRDFEIMRKHWHRLKIKEPTASPDFKKKLAYVEALLFDIAPLENKK